MNRLRLVLPNNTYKDAYLAMMDEWLSFGGRLNPGALRLNKATYETWLTWMEEDKNTLACPEGTVPQTLYFAVTADNELVGAASIRHTLNPRKYDGHVGYGVRPSQRKKGYAKEILALAIHNLNERGIDEIQVTCAADNIGSKKTILANGGIFDCEEIDEDGISTLLFRIHTSLP